MAEVLDRLGDHGLKLKQEKYSLGHHIDAEDVHTSPSIVEAITKALTPKNAAELHSFLRMASYYGKFVPNLAAKLHPLHTLLKNGVKWNWSDECVAIFSEV